ncbi:unnamed protein product, partial [Discosporangium mesarthrocarpum]
MLTRQGHYLEEHGADELVRRVALERWEEPQSTSMMRDVAAEMLDRLGALDINQFFAWPVDESDAPGYGSLIAHPMDFHTMRERVRAGAGAGAGGGEACYRSAAELRDDLVLVFGNCMTFNNPETVYYEEAERL